MPRNKLKDKIALALCYFRVRYNFNLKLFGWDILNIIKKISNRVPLEDERLMNLLYKRTLQDFKRPVIQGEGKHQTLLFCLNSVTSGATKNHIALFLSWANSFKKGCPHLKIKFFISAEHQLIFNYLKGENIDYNLSMDGNGLRTGSSFFNNPIIFEKLEVYESKAKSKNLTLRLRELVMEITKLQPTYLFFFSGVPSDSRLLRRYFFNYYPTLFTFVRYADAFPKFAHLILTEKKIDQSTEVSHISFKRFEFPVKPGKPANLLDNKIYLDEFRTNNRPIKIATILGGNRIMKTLRGYSRKELNQLLDFIVDQNVIWYFVGIEDSRDIYDISDRFMELKKLKKFEIVGTIVPLDPFLKSLDILAMFPGLKGGGGTALLSLHAKTPVLCGDDSDMAIQVGPEFAYGRSQLNEFFHHLSLLVASPQLRVETMIRQNEYCYSSSQEDFNRELALDLQKAKAIFEETQESIAN